MHDYGLIGYPLGHSFSARYFSAKFRSEGLTDHCYQLFELSSIKNLLQVLQEYPDLRGLNVTIPYKQSVLPYLHALDPVAARIGAVNTIKITPDKQLTGYNTDWIGFRDALLEFLDNQPIPAGALILGSGGSAQAVKAALEELGIGNLSVSRNPAPGSIGYSAITETLLRKYKLIVNTTPLGMQPDIDSLPAIPYRYLTKEHFLFDLVYNPVQTAFMKRGEEAAANVCNGLRMLELQAEAAWEIWQRPIQHP